MDNLSFSKVLPTAQFAWDSTSLGLLKSCPRKYYYKMILGWGTKGESVDLKFGQLYHATLERYDHFRAEGQEFEDARCAAVLWLLQQTWDSKLSRPWFSDSPYKNRLTLVRTVVWYLEQFKEDPCVTVILANGKPAVELSFRMPTGQYLESGEEILLCGHLDRLVEFNSQTYVMDRKTTKMALGDYYFRNFTPDNQFSLYCFATKVLYQIPTQGLIVDAAQVLVDSSRFQRELVPRPEGVLEEWYSDTLYYIRLAETFAKANYWPMNDKSCGMYKGCEYRGVCSKSPASRQVWLEGEFVQQVWDPLQVRGDI